MKQIGKIVIITIILLISVTSAPINSVTRRYIKFALYAFSTTMTKESSVNKEITFEKPIPIIQVFDDGIKVTKIEKNVSTDNYVYDTPKLDENGDPILIDTKGPYAKVELSKALNNSLNMRSEGYSKKFIIAQILYDYPAVQPRLAMMYFTPEGRRMFPYKFKYDETFLRNHMCSFAIIDEDFNYQLETFTDNDYRTVEFMSFNSDLLDDESKQRTIGWYDIHIASGTDYNYWASTGVGYLELQIPENIHEFSYISDGKTRVTPFQNVEEKSGLITVNMELVINQLGGIVGWDKYTSDYTIKKLIYKSMNDSELAELKFTLNAKQAIFNGKSVELSIAPYENTKYYPMIALQDLEKYFGIKSHFRPMDRTLLIEKFHVYDRVD